MEARTCRPDIAVGATAILDTYWSRARDSGRSSIDRSPTAYRPAARRRRRIGYRRATQHADGSRNMSIAHAPSMRAGTRNRKHNVDRRSRRRKLTTMTDSNATHECRAQATYVSGTSRRWPRHAWLDPPSPSPSSAFRPIAKESFVSISQLRVSNAKCSVCYDECFFLPARLSVWHNRAQFYYRHLEVMFSSAVVFACLLAC